MTDHFERLGLPRRFSINASELDRAYEDRSRAVHPDYHLGGSAGELSASLDLSAAVNEAYNVLRDPFARADYLLRLDGNVPAPGNARLPPAFLGEMLEAREAIEAARGNATEVARLEQDFVARLNECEAKLGALFSQTDEALPAADPGRANLRAEIRDLLNQAKYVRRLIDDLHAD